jgi:hypothetical protein
LHRDDDGRQRHATVCRQAESEPVLVGETEKKPRLNLAGMN